MNFLIINFKITAAHKKLNATFFLVNESKDLCKAIRNNASLFRYLRPAEHCVSLATASLSVGEYSPIVPFDDRLDKRERTLIIDSLLLRVHVVYLVEGENFAVFVFFEDFNLIAFPVDLQNRFASLFLF